jgi:hypothetical protein
MKIDHRQLILASERLAMLNELRMQLESILFDPQKTEVRIRPTPQVPNILLRNISHRPLEDLHRLEVVNLSGLHLFDRRRSLQ